MPLSRFLSHLSCSFLRYIISLIVILFIFFAFSNPINLRAQSEKRTYPNDLAKSSKMVFRNDVSSNRYTNLLESSWKDDCKSSSLNKCILLNNYGIAFLVQGNYDGASNFFNDAKSKVESKGLFFETEILDFHLGIAAIGISNGRNSKNSPVSQPNHFNLISPLKFDNYGLNYYKGFQSIDAQNFSNAKKYFLLDIQNGNDYVGRSNFALAYSLYHLGNYKASLGLLDSSTYTIRLENNLIRGNIYLKNKSYREAIDNYDKLQSAGEEKSTFVVPKVRDGLLIPPRPGTGVTFAYNFIGKISEVYTLIEEGECRKAEKLLSQNFDQGEIRKYHFHYANALIQFRNENWQECVKSFRVVLDKNPNLAHAYLGSALCNYRIGNKQQTKIDLDKAIGLDNKLWAAREARALYFFSEHDQVNAMQDIDFIFQSNVEYEFSYDALISIGFYYFQRGNKASFELVLQELQNRFSEKAGTFMLQGLSLDYYLNEKRLALVQFEKAIKTEDTVSNYWANLANTYYSLGYGLCDEEIEENEKKEFAKRARGAFEKAIALDPSNVYAWNGMSMCFLEENRLDSARYYAERALMNFKSTADLSKEHFRKEYASLLMNAQYVAITFAEKLKGINSLNDSVVSVDFLMKEAWDYAQIGMGFTPDTLKFYINQGLGWQQLNDTLMMNKYYEKSVGTRFEFAAHNNKGVNYFIQFSDEIRANEEWDLALNQTSSKGNTRLINSNKASNKEFTNILFYIPVMDWRPLEIKVKVELPVLYFDPPLPLVVGPFLSAMPEETICRQLVNEEPLPKNFNTDKSDTVKPCVAVKKKNNRRK